jgi:predicted RNA-binding Zn-ribbon protein involved in translation (DUF1610 family)
MPKRSKNPRRRSDDGAYCIGCGLWVPSEGHVQHKCPGRGLDRRARAQVRRIVAHATADAFAAVVAQMKIPKDRGVAPLARWRRP